MRDGSLLIAMGLVGLAASAYLPAMPLISAMALVAWGATAALGSRMANSPFVGTAMVVHLFVYLSLYLVFVGAVIHAAISGPQSGIGAPLILDCGTSAVLMTMVIRKAVARTLDSFSP